jgi:hypothetical protein
LPELLAVVWVPGRMKGLLWLVPPPPLELADGEPMLMSSRDMPDEDARARQ